MKKQMVLLCLVLLILCGCSLPPPADTQGLAWSEDWVTVGNVVGVDTPEGLTPRENIDTLTASEIYYATWSIGEEKVLQNGEETGATVYDAQLYLVLQGSETVEEAENNARSWLALAQERYEIEGNSDAVYNGQEFTVITCAYTAQDNPYARGAAAYGVYGNYAINAELSCMEGFEGDASAVLADFLEHCHYAA